jgi:glycosyltransferase involved in cell wall biosynthesis
MDTIGASRGVWPDEDFFADKPVPRGARKAGERARRSGTLCFREDGERSVLGLLRMADEVEQLVSPISTLMVVDEDVFGRLGTTVRQMCVGMMDEVIRVTTLARSTRQVEESVGPSRLCYLPKRCWPWRWQVLNSEDALELIGGEKPNVIHCLSPRLVPVVSGWATAWGCHIVVHLTDLQDVRRFVRLHLPPDIIAIATTPSIQQILIKKRPKLADSIRVVPLGIPAEAEPACFADPDRVPAGLVTAPLTHDCGLHLVLKAMEAVIAGGQEMHLFVVSSGPAEYVFRRVVRQLGLRTNVTFAGELHDWAAIRAAMRDADFYVLPAERRRFTVSTLMAMATGLAILAPTGTIGDYLIDGVTATLFDPQKPRQIAERLAALLADKAGARRLGQGALEYIRAHHQASAMVSSLARIYRELCHVNK